MATKISLYRGATYPSVYQHTDGDGVELPLTGCTVFFTIKSAKYDEDSTDATAIFTATVTSHTDAAAGLTGWDTLIPSVGVDPGKYYFDICVQDSGGEKLPPVIIGECQILGKRTNRSS